MGHPISFGWCQWFASGSVLLGLYTSCMRLGALCLVMALAGGVSLSAQTGVQAVSASFPAAQSGKALDGRLYFLLSNDASEEPRMQIDDTPRS
jgi:hypothetical protein